MNDLLDNAVSDREAHPWRYYRLDHEQMKKIADRQDAALASLREQLAEAQREAVGLLTQNTETWNRAIAAEREVAALKAQGACEWTPQDRGDDGWYSTDCGQEFCTIDDAPVPAEFKFCVYCGKPLAVAPVAPTPEG